mgnify:CR=1 FL=1
MSDLPLPPLALIANARMPSQRAQSLQVLQVASAFERAGAPTSLLHAQRIPTPSLPQGVDLFTYYALAPGPRPRVSAIPCTDWIDRVPTLLQYVPARVQELTFARNAANFVRRNMPDGRVLSREAESALSLLRGSKPHPNVYIEVHRVPGGKTRRRWLIEAAAGARGLIAISGGVREDLISMGIPSADILVEHDGFEAGHEPLSRVAARAKLGLDASAPIVTYTGGLLAWKGVDLVVDAAASLPDVTFVIVGGMDRDVQRLRLRVEESRRAGASANIRLEGFVAPTEVRTYLAAADLGLVPNRSKPAISSKYTSPLKVFEAMEAGLPLVVSDLPSLREILSGDEATFFPADDASGLGVAIANTLGDRGRLNQMAERMKERAKLHSWDARAKRILAWMDQRESLASNTRGVA